MLRAAVVAAAFSGAPSTAFALAQHSDPLEATWAAGRLVLPGERPGTRLFAAAALAHGTLALVWTAMLSAALPKGSRTQRATLGAVAGLGIAAVDLGAAHLWHDNPRLAPIAGLAVAPQVADHVAFGALVGLAL